MEISANILRILNNNLKKPAFILDEYGELLALNESARKLYSPDLPLSSFWTLFVPENVPQIEKAFHDSILSSKSQVESATLIQNNEKRNVELTFSGLGENGVKIFLCTFDFDFSTTEKIKFTIKSEELINIIRSKEFIKIFEEIKSSFPFTLLGKAKIRNEIDKIDDFFWLKDIEGKYLLVNNKFARNLGLKPAQVEGKYEKEFLPKYLSGFLDSVGEFIQNTSNMVIREGLTQPVSSDQRKLSVIEFPLCDLDNRAIAVIGIAQDITNSENQTNLKSQDIISLINVLNSPSAILNQTGEVLFSNQRFSELLSGLSNDEKDEFNNSIKTLCSGLNNSNEITLELKKFLRNKNDPFVFNAGKLYNSNENFTRYLIQVNKFSEDANTQILLNNRGKMYEVIMQASPEPMFIYDIDNLRFLEVNKAALDLYGFSRTEFLQMDLTDLYAPEDIQTLLGSGNHKNKEGVFTGPWRHKKRDGSSILVEISKVNFEYKTSKAHFNIIRDVTDKIELNKEIQLYKNIFENTRDMIFVTDPEGFITFANKPVLNTLGYSNDELDTRPIITLVTDDFRSDLSSAFYSTEKISSLTDIEFKRKDGSTVSLNLIFTPIYDFNEQVVSYNVIAHIGEKPVISKPESKEATLQNVATIDTTLLSSMFHEILTPINVILGFVQEITENIQEPNEEIKEASEIINQNRQVLLQTMDSILEYSHIQQNRIDFKPEKIFFTDILDNLQKNTKKTAESNKIEFSYGKISSSLNIETDPHRMESLLTMFITAAMRITKEKTIFISAYQYDDSSYIISLKDNRRDISPYLAETLNHVIASDIKDLKKDYGISKLSIHLARKLINILKAEFKLVKKSGVVNECGFVFPLEFNKVDKLKKSEEENRQIETETQSQSVETVLKEEILIEPQPVIPEREVTTVEEESPKKHVIIEKPEPEFKQEAEDPAKIQKQAVKLEISGLRCLYVEDQIDSQILFKVQMKELKHIDFAVSFEAALPLLEQNKYDFIIMDINLQGEYNGLDALRIIRRLPGYNQTQIIAVTAYVLPGDKEKFIAAGFNDFISKPILREKLIDSLTKILN